MANKYLVVGFIKEVYIIDTVEADSKDEALEKTKLGSDDKYTIEEDQFDAFIKDKKRINRECEIDIGILNKETSQIEFNVD